MNKNEILDLPHHSAMPSDITFPLPSDDIIGIRSPPFLGELSFRFLCSTQFYIWSWRKIYPHISCYEFLVCDNIGNFRFLAIYHLFCFYVRKSFISFVLLSSCRSEHSWLCVFKPNSYAHTHIYTGCPMRNVTDFGRVFLMLNYTYITQYTYVQSRTVTEIMAREKCGLHRSRRTKRRPWRHTCPMPLPDQRDMIMQWSWRVRYSTVALTSQDNRSAATCVKYLEV